MFTLESLSPTKPIVIISLLVILYVLELSFPFFEGRKGKFKHAVKNLGLGLLNTIIISLFFVWLVILVTGLEFTKTYGLLNILNLPLVIELIIMIFLFDVWMYAWHVMNHKLPFFWRFHRVHHSDLEVDATSALRFHTGEIILSTLARLPIIAILGLKLEHILLYEIILLPVILFHHSNVNFPERYDRIYRAIFASPHMHWIHHSQIQKETDSNYGSIFSFWDRIFKTFRLRKTKNDYQKIEQGLKEYIDEKWNSFVGMLKIPFVKK